MKKINFTIYALFILCTNAIAQVPTVQDCLGAIPVTKSIYYEVNSYLGEGNYPNEIDSSISCLGTGEKNSVWYTFKAKANGAFSFSIIPNVMTDDYDWAVYNLTNNYCSDIFNDASLEVACNFAGASGITGANGLPGAQNEPPFQVLAGETFVLNISQFNWSTNGYTLILDSIELIQSGFVEGTVIVDKDSDCVLNGNDYLAPHRIIDINNGTDFATTNDTGVFRYLGDTGAFTLTLVPRLYYPQHCPANFASINGYLYTYNDSILGNDFAQVPILNITDIVVDLQATDVRPGFQSTVTANLNNVGTTTVSDTLWVSYSSFLTYDGVVFNTPVPDTIGTNQIGWYYANLLPDTYSRYQFLLHCDSSIALGTQYFISCTTGSVNDSTPANNSAIKNDSVIGSYDPNAKKVSPAGYGPLGKILPSTPFLDYTIHFQNTGTANADRVILIDTLDKDLDIASLTILGASHNFTWDLSGPGVLKFTFNNINLPYTSIDEPGSHGYAKFRVNLKPNLLAGTEIKNTARIYFDFNNPIITNTTLNTIDLFLGINDKSYTEQVTMFPNPVDDILNLKIDKNLKGIVEVYTTQGKLVFSNNIASQINVSQLETGLYFTVITLDNSGHKLFNKFLKR